MGFSPHDASPKYRKVGGEVGLFTCRLTISLDRCESNRAQVTDKIVWSSTRMVTEQLKLRFDVQFFNVFNHPNFGLPSTVLAGIPGKPATQTGFGALTYTTSPPTGLLGVGLGGDSTPRMIAFQLRMEF